uniref:Uncharacterized protein n=1 Tax=Rousettus aegyptiacus TaxID=9407 RepID=A0A7J8D6F2_ROUAE|nr:hypothetical protein HJG63_008743 [Rousettus aegyptiacus]
MSSDKSDSLTSFSIWMHFISFSCLIALVRTSNVILNNSGDCGQPCLVSDLRGKVFSFSPLSIMLAEGLSYMDFIMFKYFPSIPILLIVLIINGCCILSKAFSASVDMILCFLFFNLFMWYITLINLHMLNHPCAPRMKLT